MMTVDQIYVTKQNERILYSKLEVLDSKLRVVRELTGFLIDGDYDIHAKTGTRRTCDVEFIVNKDTVPAPSSPIWINKNIRLYIGILNLITDEPVWFPIGTFALNDPSQNISISGKNTLRIKASDFTSFMDGTIGGSLGSRVIVNCGDSVHNALLNTMKEFTNFNTNIGESKYTVPYKIEKEADDDIWDLVKEIIELYMNYEGFFDVWGTFVFQETSNLINDSVVWDFSIPENNLIQSASIEYNWGEVRNRVTVIGKDKDGAYPSYTSVALSGNKGWAECPYTIDKLGEVESFDYKLPLPLIDKIWSNVQASTPEEEELYHIKDLAQKNNWDKVTAIENTVGEEVRSYLIGVLPVSQLKVKFNDYKVGDEFEKFISDPALSDYKYNPRSLTIKESNYYKQSQCITRAQYELDKRLSGSEKVKLTIAPIYGLDVNQLIYLDMTIDNTPVVGKYCIDEISCKVGVGGDMHINCHKVTQARYNFDPNILYDKDGEGWQYPDRITINKDGEVGTGDGEIVINNLLDASLVSAYSLDITEQKDIKDMFWITKGFDFNIDMKRFEANSILTFCGEELERMGDGNWKTQTYAIGGSIISNEGWIGENNTGLPSYWDKFSHEIPLYPEDLAKMDVFLPSFIINKFKLTRLEAKEITWVGLCYARRTSKKDDFSKDVSKNYLTATLTNKGGVLKIAETFDRYSELHRDINGNWYTAKYLYGQNLFTNKGWLGEKPKDKELYPFNEEETGFLRVDFDEVMSGKKNILS